MIIAISGSVGSGKTTIAKTLADKLDYEIIHLNELAKNYKIAQIPELQTFDFDLDKLLDELEQNLEKKVYGENVVLEGHFAHFLKPEFVDKLIIIGRDLTHLKKEYKNRNYNEQKIKDNLEVESFNLCFHEALEEGYEEEKQVYLVENNGSIQDTLDKIKMILIL